jgi:hypothetical protein
MAAMIVQKRSQIASQEELSRILSEIEALSEIEVEQILAREIPNRR